MTWKTFDAAQVIAQHSDISSEQIELALRVIGYQSHTPGLQKILQRAERLAGRFEELRSRCPGLSEVIDCFALAGRLAKFTFPELGSHGKHTYAINASKDFVFSLSVEPLDEIEWDVFAISWVAHSVALIHPLQASKPLQTATVITEFSLLSDDIFKQAGSDKLHVLPFWERLENLCARASEEDSYSDHISAFRETLADLGARHISGLQSPHAQLSAPVQLQLTERTLTSAHWHFPRPAELESLRSHLGKSSLAERSQTQNEKMIILIALATGRDISQALTIKVRGYEVNSKCDEQCLAFRRRGGHEVLPINSARGNLVKSVFEKENGLEEAVFRRADHRLFAAGRSRHTDQGTVSAAWFQ